jgi:DNA repair exonuclease SbcCD nuclease subunit
MKIALLCDTHIGARNDSKVFLEHQANFFEKIFFPYLEEHSIDTVLHLGDIFDRRKYINFYTLKRSREFLFDKLRDKSIKVHAILGNHDTFFTTTNEVNSVVLLLREYDNITVYEDDLTHLNLGSSRIAMCPWLTKENSEKNLDAIAKSDAHILCGHFDMKGFEMMRGVLSDHGLDYKTFSHFESVYSGHYHHQSKYGNVTYLGAQYEMNWSDYGCKKGFHVLDTETRELTFVENDVRIYHKLTYDDAELTLDEISSLDTSVLKNTYVKVVVKNRINPYLYDLFLNRLNDSGAADIKTVEDSLNLSDAGMEDVLDEAKDTKEILHSYIDAVETTIDKSKIKSVMDQLYIEAINL